MWVNAHVAELLFYGRIVCVVSGYSSLVYGVISPTLFRIC